MSRYYNNAHFVNQHPTSQKTHPTSHIPNMPHPPHPTSPTSHIPNIPHLEHPTSRTFHIPNIPHPRHCTSQTSYISRIPHPEHPTTRQKHHMAWKNCNRTAVAKVELASLKVMKKKKFQTKKGIWDNLFCWWAK